MKRVIIQFKTIEKKGVLRMGKLKKILLGIVITILILGALAGVLIGFYTDYLWFKDLGYVSVFFTKLLSQLKLGIPCFVILTLLIRLYLKFINGDYFKKMEIVSFSVKDKTINKVSWGLSVLFALVATIMTTTSLWYEIMSFINKTDFNLDDPLFGLDISTYIFTLPLANQIYSIATTLIIMLLVVTVIYYAFLMSVRRPKLFQNAYDQAYAEEGESIFQDKRRLGKKIFSSNWKAFLDLAVRQVVVLAVIFFVVIGLGYFLKQFQLMYHQGSTVYGASFVDVNIYLWQYRILMVMAAAAAVLFAVGIAKKKYKLALVMPVLMIVVSLAGNGVGLLVQNFIVAPDEISKESPYIDNNIQMTQAAYGIADIEENSFAADDSLTAEDIIKNEAIFENIRINDFEPTKQFYNQRQSIKQYYTFNDVDVDRYMIDGDYTQVFLSAREIDETRINSQWITKHLKYTHGYGLTLSRVNSITASGQPDILIENVPPESSIEEIQITRPEIYFGELTNDYVIVNTDEKEFDYPLGESNVYTEYEGNSGINLNLLNRVLYAIREQSMKILVSTNISADSRILVDRNIVDRVNKIAPYLTYDSDPYLVVSEDGKLFWMMDAYTTSSYYPYAEPYADTLNYIRNSVKVVVDAYNGDVDFYIVDESDPLVMTMSGVFPELFKSIDQMPEDLQQHIRYPKALFEIQANMYTKYHMTDVNVFYQGEDQWDIANEIYGQEQTKMTSNYYIMSLPGSTEEEFVLSISYTPISKNNMTGLLIARSDGEHYGELKLYRMPKGETVYGPAQVEAQIDQDPTISKEFSLWSQRGSTYLRGNIFVIPVEDSLLYVEPIYLQADNESSLPEVKRVIAVYNDVIAYEETLGEALKTLFGKDIGSLVNVGEVDAPAGEPDAEGDEGSDGQGSAVTGSQEELIQKANDAFNNAVAAQKSGDWAAYGDYLDQLQRYLQALEGDTTSVQ